MRMYKIFRDQIWKDLGPLDPDWFEALTAEAFEEGDVLDKDELSINQDEMYAIQESHCEVLRAHQEELCEELHANQEKLCEELCANQEAALLKSPMFNRGHYSPMSSTPRVFRLNRTPSPETDHDSVQQDGDQNCSSSQPKSYPRDLSERLGAQMGNISWSSSLNTPPPMPSTWILTRRESESTVTLSGERSIFARKLFHCNQSASADGSVHESPMVPEDAEVTANDKMIPYSTYNAVEGFLHDTENTTYTDHSSILRKVKNERIHMRLITPTNKNDHDAVAPPPTRTAKDISSESPPENPALNQWSPINLSELQTELFTPSACLNALKQAKLKKRGEGIGQLEIRGQDPALTLKPSSAHHGGFSTTAIPVSDLGNLTRLADEFKINTGGNTVSNDDPNLTVSQKAEVKELCKFLEQSGSQFDFTQTTIYNINQVSQNKGCTTLKSEALPSSSPANIQTRNQSIEAENCMHTICEASDTEMEMKSQTLRNHFEERNVNTSFTPEFKMASGKGVILSDKNLQKSKELFIDLVHDADGQSTFGKAYFRNPKQLDKYKTNSSLSSLCRLKRAHGDRHSLSAIKKVKMCDAVANVKQNHYILSENSHVQNTNLVAACRKPLIITAHVKCSSVDNKESSCTNVGNGAMSNLANSDYPKYEIRDEICSADEIFPGFKTIEQPTFKGSQSKRCPGDNHVSLTKTSGFPTNDICVSSEYKMNTRHDETKPSLQKICAAISPQNQAFQTAGGAKVNVSSEVLTETKHLWNECNSQSKALVMRGNGSVPPTSVFLAASGKALSVSAEALLKGKALFDISSTSDTKDTSEIHKTSVLTKSINKYVPGKIESLSSQKNSSTHSQLSTDCSSDSSASNMALEYCASRNGFTTASGRKLRVSEESLKKAIGLLSEGTVSENRLPGIKLRKASMDNKCVMTSSDEPGQPTCESMQSSKAEMRSSTARDGNVQAKKDKERACLLLEHSLKRSDTTPVSNTEKNCGSSFTTASGKKVSVPEEALYKAMKMLSSEIKLHGDNSCKPGIMTRETNASRLQPGFVKSTSSNGVDKRLDHLTLNPNQRIRINETPEEESCTPLCKEVNVPPVVVNLDVLQICGCSSTQQQFLTQEALACTRALLEDEVRCAQSLTVGLKQPSTSTSSLGEPQQKRNDGTDKCILKRSLAKELDRACNEPKKTISNPLWISRGGLLKDRKVFQYHHLCHPNTTRQHRCLKEQVNTNPVSPAKRGPAEPEPTVFLPPFLIAKSKTSKEGTQKDKEKTCTFVPPFKKHRSYHGNLTTLTKDDICVKQSSTTHIFIPPAPERQNPWNDNISKHDNDPDVRKEKAPECEVDKPSKTEEPMRVVHRSAMKQEADDAAEGPCYETLESIGDLAQDMQDMRIRKKRQQSIKAIPGSLFLTKSSQVKLSFRTVVDGETPQKYSQKQLYQFGVHHQVCHITSQTAEGFCFNLLKLHKPQSFLEAGGMQLADGGWLIPRRDGTVGKEEFYKALCDTPGVDPKLISPQWVYNHYRWIVWKLASMERAFPLCMASICLTPEQVLLHLKYRYDVEVDQSRRSSLKKIMEKDDTSAKTIVLCVCGVFSNGQLDLRPVQETCIRPEKPCAIVWLTDGWYCIKTQLDAPLTAMLHRGHIAEGVKLIIHGAQLLGSEEACTPLEAPDSLLLKIWANSTRRVRWDTKLGFYKDARPFVLPLYSLFSKGGAVGSVDMVILRIYPTQWMERKPDGGVVFRSGHAEEKEARRYNNHKQKHLEAIYTKIKAQFEKEDRERLESKTRRRSVRHKEMDRFQDGEELYEAVGDELSDVEAYLSAEQLQTLCSYKHSMLEQRQAELQRRLRKAVEDAEASKGSCPRRNVAPVWKMSVMDHLDQTSSSVYQLSVWRPSAELQALLKEGCRYRAYNLTASEGRTGGSRPTVQLTATRKTLFTCLQASSHWLLAHFRPRASVSFAELQNPNFLPLCGEVDLTGCIISVTDLHGSSPIIYLVDEGLNMVKVHACVSLTLCGWEDVVQVRALVSLSNLQVKGCVSDPPVLPVLYTGDMTELSTNPQESHLQQSLGRLRQALQDQDDFFLRAEQRLIEILTPGGQSFTAVDPRTPQSKQITNDTLENWTAPTPGFKHPAWSNWSTKKDLRSLKRRKSLDHLCQYTPPSPLISAASSSSVNKTFCPPRRSQSHTRTTGSADVAPVEQGWVHDEELALIDTQELRAADSNMD